MREPDARSDSSKAGLKPPERVDVSSAIAVRWKGWSSEADEPVGPSQKKEEKKRRMCLSQTDLGECAGTVKEVFPEIRGEVRMALSAKEGTKCRAGKA